MKIQVHIERLVLDGLPADRQSAPLIQAAVQAELTRLFAGGSAPGLLAGTVVPSLRTPPIQIVPQSHPRLLGSQIAGAVYGGLQQ